MMSVRKTGGGASQDQTDIFTEAKFEMYKIRILITSYFSVSTIFMAFLTYLFFLPKYKEGMRPKAS